MLPPRRSCHRNLFRVASLEIHELDPNLFSVADLHFERIQPARRRTGWIIDLSSQRERAVMTRTAITSFFRIVIHKTTRVRTDDIESVDLAIRGASQVNSTHRNVRKL